MIIFSACRKSRVPEKNAVVSVTCVFHVSPEDKAAWWEWLMLELQRMQSTSCLMPIYFHKEDAGSRQRSHEQWVGRSVIVMAQMVG